MRGKKDIKENIKKVFTEEAIATLEHLTPVQYNTITKRTKKNTMSVLLPRMFLRRTENSGLRNKYCKPSPKTY